MLRKLTAAAMLVALAAPAYGYSGGCRIAYRNSAAIPRTTSPTELAGLLTSAKWSVNLQVKKVVLVGNGAAGKAVVHPSCREMPSGAI